MDAAWGGEERVSFNELPSAITQLHLSNLEGARLPVGRRGVEERTELEK